MNRQGMLLWTNILLLVANMSQMYRRRVRSDISIALPSLDGVLRNEKSYSNLAQPSARSNRSSRRALQVEFNERLTKQLVWYHKHRHELLPIHQRPLARKKLHEVLRMKPATRRAWIHHLEVATESWERNKYLTTPGQRTLLDYFPGSAPPRPPPRNITREARTQADIGVLRLEHDQVRIDHVLNPVE